MSSASFSFIVLAFFNFITLSIAQQSEAVLNVRLSCLPQTFWLLLRPELFLLYRMTKCFLCCSILTVKSFHSSQWVCYHDVLCADRKKKNKQNLSVPNGRKSTNFKEQSISWCISPVKLCSSHQRLRSSHQRKKGTEVSNSRSFECLKKEKNHEVYFIAEQDSNEELNMSEKWTNFSVCLFVSLPVLITFFLLLFWSLDLLEIGL